MMQADRTRRYDIDDKTRFAHFGRGVTTPYATGSADINLDMEHANSKEAQCKSGQPSSQFPRSYDSQLAHELGHAFSGSYSSERGEGTSTQWENSVGSSEGRAPRQWYSPPVRPGCAR